MLDKLRQMPVFTIGDIKKIKAYKSEKSYPLLVYRLKKQKKITEIEKGKFTLSTDPYLVATNIITPSYLSFWSCSYYKGFTEQIVNTIQIACTVKKKDIIFMNQRIKFIKLRPKLMFGFKKDKNNVFVASDEKLLIDSLLFQKQLGNFDEIIKTARNSNINKNIMTDYLKNINNISITKRIGYVLEKYKSMDIYDEFKELIKKDKNYIKLDTSSKSKIMNKKWRLII